MCDVKSVTPTPKKRHGLLKTFAWSFGVLIVLLVIIFFVATSSAFFKGSVLPRVGKAINARITVSDASIKPFKHVVLHDLEVLTTGAEPLVSASEVRLRYSLMDIIRGTIHVDEVSVAALRFALVENPDGSTNLDPILESQKRETPEAKSESPVKTAAAKPLKVDLKKFELKDMTLRRIKNFANNTREVVELTHANFTLEDLKNGETAQLALNTDVNMQQTNATLRAKLAGTFALALTPDLKPSLINGSTRLDVTRAEGALSEAADFGSAVNVEITPTEIKELALRFHRGDASLGELKVSGALELQKLEGCLNIALAGIDKQLLNLVGMRSGMDFGSTRISSTNKVELMKGGSMIKVRGQLDVQDFQLTRMQQSTPLLELRNEYDVTVERDQSMAALRMLTITGTRKGDPLLKGELTSPMQISWGGVSNAVGDSAFTLAVTDFNLADWKPFTGEVAPAGIVNLTTKVLAQQGGRQLMVDLDSRIDHLTVNTGSNHIADLSVAMRASARATELKQLDLKDWHLEVAHQSEKLTAVNASGTYDTESGSADMQVAFQALLPALLRTIPQPGMTLSSGVSEMKARITQKHNVQAITGDFALTDLSGQLGASELSGLGTTMNFDVGMESHKIKLRQLQIALEPTARASNKLQLTGQLDISKPSAIRGNLNLASESLDFTGYYDLFANGKQASKQKPATTPIPDPAPVDANREPDPITLPFSSFTVGTNIEKLYLRDIEIADWQSATEINAGHVVVNPFRLTLNEAPVSSAVDLDLGLPGWKYDLSFSALSVPLTPLVDSFLPDRKGQINGTMTAQAHISGAGITGAGLQKNLAGEFGLSSTNLNLKAADTKSPVLTTLTKSVSRIPELLKGSKGKLGSLLSGLRGRADTDGNESEDLKQAPISDIIVQGTAGAGRIELQKAMVRSSSFQADVDGGAITLEPVLTNSTIKIPVSIALARATAQQIGLVTASTPTNAILVKVPDFLTLTGTIGAPKPQINPLALASTVTEAIKELRSGRRAKDKSRSEVKGASDQPADATTDQTPAAPKLENLINGLFKQKKKRKGPS